ncbi:hypothetical protein G7054_g14428 [Neopestalotiopsis clavispora]|nr:hypothetical protein G7054_g14428 [Neopestalotiopsis clavispora]
MSDKHFFPETAANTLVPRYLRALTAANPHLGLIDSERVVFSKENDPSTVSIISGGGSGHEPGWSGFVGDGALSAVACGDIFASPSTKQVLAATRAVPSNEGTIYMITNYTGDKLHFGLAAERAKASGLSKNVAVIPLTDDVSLGRTKSAVVGRRGMPGHVVPMKIVGAAAKKHGFQKCVDIAKAVNAQVVSIGSALDHCHVPGRAKHETLPADVVVVGAGIHNEPGAQRLSPFPPVEDLIAYCLKLLCDPNDAERAFVKFNKDDEVVLVINNYGGLSNLELGALTDETIIQLGRTWNIKPVRILSDAFETSLNGPGFSISLCNLANASKECSTSVGELLEFLDQKTSCVAWPNVVRSFKETTASPSDILAAAAEEKPKLSADSDIKVDPSLLDSIIRTACKAAIAAEPKLTQWDMIMGDGDCGEAVQGVSESIIKTLDNGIAKEGSVLSFLFSTTEAVDDMGGSLGAILGILLSAFTSALQDNVKANGGAPTRRPREGDRTVMDVLIPFADAFAQSSDFHGAVQVAHTKAEGTKSLKAKFGRASYVSEAEGQDIPDPGAWAFYEFVAGMSKAIKGQ